MRPRTVVFANDTIGTDIDGAPATVERDIVVTGVVVAPDGAVLVTFSPYVEGSGRTS